MSDPEINDIDRRGSDLLARIDELTKATDLTKDATGNGWRFLLLACKNEIDRLELWLRELVERDDEPCRLDHHGFCQSHLFSPPCSIAEASKVLKGFPDRQIASTLSR